MARQLMEGAGSSLTTMAKVLSSTSSGGPTRYLTSE
jgi:hypothetical protein